MVGTEAPTERVTWATPLPAELVAVTSKVVRFKIPVGAPLILQVVSWRERPSGRSGEMVQRLISPPLGFRVEGVTFIMTPTEPFTPLD